MTESKTPQTIPPPRPRVSILRQVLTLIFRLLLLGVGGGLAFLVGAAIAHFYPASNPQEPLIERMRRSSTELVNPKISRNPSASQIAASSASKQLSTQQQQTLQAELQQLQTQYQQVVQGTTALETQLGNQRLNQPLETRLQELSEALAVNPTQSTSAQSPAKFFVTLPSDVLFVRNEANLKEETMPVLDNIVLELQNYSKAAIRVATHTDDTAEAQTNQILSLERAQAVQQYLADRLNSNYQWTVIGFGETRPLVPNDTENNRQRNRRIEIAVD